MYLFCIFLYILQDDADDHDCKLDLEDVLDLDTDSERRQYAIVSIQLRRGMRFPTMWHLTCVDSDEPLQPPVKLRNSKWCSVRSLTII